MMGLLHEAEFWVLLGFIIFIALVWKKAKLALGSSLDSRAERIRLQIVEAEKLRAEAETMLRDAEQRQKAALQEAQAMLTQAQHDATLLKEQSAKDMAALLERRRQSAVEKIAQAEATALAEVRQYAVDVAIADRMIDQAIPELPRRLA